MKTIVTHLAPDLDAATSIWLVKKFFPNFDQAEIKFVPAGKTLADMPPDTDINQIIHVDTGLGLFDHHQLDQNTSAAKLVFEHLKKQEWINDFQTQILLVIVEYVNNIDHFGEVFFPDAAADFYEFCLNQIVDGLRYVIKDDQKIVVRIGEILDGIYNMLALKIKAQEEIRNGYVFESKYGKSIMLVSHNAQVLKLAQKLGYVLVIKKDPIKGFVSIKTLPDPKYDLTPIYEQIKKIDNKGTWFFHISKNMLINGSTKNPYFTPTPLTPQQLIEIIKKI
jgi:hypothetical protein